MRLAPPPPPIEDRPPARRRRDDPSVAEEAALWLTPSVVALFFLATILLTFAFPAVFPRSAMRALLFVLAFALNMSIIAPLVHVIICQSRDTFGPQHRSS